MARRTIRSGFCGRLPRDVRVELDARSESDGGRYQGRALWRRSLVRQGEIATEATSYVIIFGGWNNTMNVLARMDEHGADRIVEDRPAEVEPGRTYHFRDRATSGGIADGVGGWSGSAANGGPGPALLGRGHDHFGFNNWQSDLWFDNLRVTPL